MHTLLQARFGEEAESILPPVWYANWFDSFPVHKSCYYDHSSTSAQDPCRCIQKTKNDELPLIMDDFGMTPFHILFLTVNPREDLLEVFLDDHIHTLFLAGKMPVVAGFSVDWS
ncbi:unnamed protein product [Cylindrotheca closterium]|uniref:Uncharacterized protein n=1 Tax=Cylindrotheca closterium TaxID=2856 RepID=A0AAD2G421_9STRA|nr:unnamed protein product [Cylindrotheca closterium]